MLGFQPGIEEGYTHDQSHENDFTGKLKVFRAGVPSGSSKNCLPVLQSFLHRPDQGQISRFVFLV